MSVTETAVVSSLGCRVAARLISLGADHASLFLPRPRMPAWSLGSPVLLAMRFGEPMQEVVVPALVTGRTEVRAGRRYALQVDWHRLWATVPADVRGTLEQRRDLRVPVSQALRAIVTLPVEKRALVGQLSDVSSRGLGLFLPMAAEGLVHEATRANVRFHLSGTQEALRVSGSIRHRHLESGGLVYGIAVERFQDQRVVAALNAFVRQSRRSRAAG